MLENRVSVGIVTQINIAGYQQNIILIGTKGQNSYTLAGNLNFQQPISLNQLIQDLAKHLSCDISEDISNTLNPLGLIVKELTINYEENKGYSFICSSQYKINEDKSLEIDIRLETKKQKRKSYLNADLKLKLTQHEFELNLQKHDDSTFLIANYQDRSQEIKLRELVNCFSSELAEEIPESLAFKIRKILLICEKKSSQSNSSKFLLSLDLDFSFTFKDLPLIGSEIPPEKNLSLENLQFLLASHEFSDINSLISQIGQGESQLSTINQADIKKGFYLGVDLDFFGEKENISFELNSPKKDDKSKPLTPNEPKKNLKKDNKPSIGVSNATFWLSINKSWKFLELKRIGLQYQKEQSVVFFLLDAAISCSSLKITCDGLGIGSSLKEFNPKFQIPGVAIDYTGTAPLEIGGAFLWQELTSEEEKQFKFKFAGLGMVKTKAFAISVMGAYTQFITGESSFLLYGVLDKTLGGPPCLVVTGLALGFGYNRAFKMPPLDKVKDFPLVKVALEGSKGGAGDLAATLRDLDTCIPPKAGEIFLAIGIKFTSFKIVNSFILLVAKFGSSFEFSFIGISTLIAPPSEVSDLIEPVSKMELAIIGTYKPEEGILKVDGKVLDGSYLFSAEGKLSGGFAFYSWFKGEHAGDFVLTIGGYHPDFKIPAHYPKVERLQFNWPKVKGSNLNLKGNVYFALTSSAIMAGGRLEANFEANKLKASFIIELHLIIAWKPFFYDIKLYISIRVSYTFSLWGFSKTINVDLSVNLHIWGPEFSGKANINLSVIQFEIAFGKGSAKSPTPLKWEQFQQSFLPTNDQICGITVTSGLIRQIGQGEGTIWVINPKEFVLTTDTVIPAKETENVNFPPGTKENASFGIASMALKASDFTTSHKITILDSNNNDVPNKFNYEPIYKNVPVALWGESIEPNLKTASLVKDVLSGAIIKPRESTKVGKTQSIDCENLKYDNQDVNNAYQWSQFVEFAERSTEIQEDDIKAEIKNSINNQEQKNKRQAILMGLGFQDEIKNIDLTDFIDEKKLQQAFVITPILREVVNA